MKHITYNNLTKLFLFSLISFSLFFVLVGRVEAVECCLITKTYNVSSKPPETSCRLKESTPCDTEQKLTDCRSEVVDGGRGGLATQQICDSKTVEESVDCEQKSNFCAYLVAKEECSKLVPYACEKAVNCFYFQAYGKCMSVFDSTICPELKTDLLCNKSKACAWKEQIGCAGIKGLDFDNTGILPPCAIAGTCNNIDDLLFVVINIAQKVLSYIGAAAFIFFIYGGFTMILSFGNPEKFKKGQQILVAAVVGLVISFSAYLLVDFLLDALGVKSDFKIL